MKLSEEIKDCKKDWVYDCYYKIVSTPKDYEKITKKKMVEEVYKLYSDYNKIISICTTRELKFLKKMIENGGKFEYPAFSFPKELNFERKCLCDKFLIFMLDDLEIPEEIYDSVCLALEKVKWKEAKVRDNINEILVSLCKMYGEVSSEMLIEMVSNLLDIPRTAVGKHMEQNLLFKYNTVYRKKYIPSIEESIGCFVYSDYAYLIEELDIQRSKQALSTIGTVDIDIYKALFYNDFNVNNKVVKSFVDELESLPFFYNEAIEMIKEFVLLNADRQPLKDAIKSVPILSDYDLTEFFKLMDAAMNEMPSGALNALTPNEYRKAKKEINDYNREKSSKNFKQKNACLPEKDVKLFYKIFFGLLEYTNKKYGINPKMKKIYKQENIDPNDIIGIRNYLWDNGNKIIADFIKENPYDFNSDELEVTKGFSVGEMSLYFIAKYEEDYTVIADVDKAYMVKGLNCNIDEVIPFNALPYPVYTVLLPFKGKIIYDGLLGGVDIDFGVDFKKMLDEEASNLMRYYHL